MAGKSGPAPSLHLCILHTHIWFASEESFHLEYNLTYLRKLFLLEICNDLTLVKYLVIV